MSEVLNQTQLEELIRAVLNEKLSAASLAESSYKQRASGVLSVKIPAVCLHEADKLSTGNPNDRVYTKDVLSLNESPRLGLGVMEMYDTTFNWHLAYDEVDYVIEGVLSIIIDGKKITASAGECLFIPKDSAIQFSVDGFARFIYVTYPADWQKA